MTMAVNDAEMDFSDIDYINVHGTSTPVGDISETNVTFELEHDAEIIADNLKIKGDSQKSGIDRVNEVMKYIISLELFTNDNGHIRCYKIAKRIDASMTSNSKLRTLINDAKNHDAVMTKSCEPMKHHARLHNTIQDETIKEESNIGHKAQTHRFSKPTLDQVQEYCTERNNAVNPQRFIDFYESKGWMVGKTKMKDWKAAVRNWEGNDNQKKQGGYTKTACLEFKDD
jgi:hypothetical protein